MELFSELVDVLGQTPDWVPLLLIPALAVPVAVLFTLFGGRRMFAFIAAAFGAAGSVLVCCISLERYPAEYAVAYMAVYAALFTALAAVLRLLFFLPRVRKRARRTSREERIYEKFRGEPLEAPAAARAGAPAKVCCFEEEERFEEPPELSHALSLLEKLQREKLAAADRLEADVLARSVGALRGRALTETERGTLNDCLASVLKLTAKYKL